MAIIKEIQIKNFRNIINQKIKFSDNINIFIADNAQGKTSLIEALYYLGHNKSFKSINLLEIINQKENHIYIKAKTNSSNIKIIKSNNILNIEVNDQKIKNISTLTKKLPIQLITIDRGFVVGGSPKNKRYYLDWGVFHEEHNFLQLHQKHKKIIKNINLLIIRQQKQQLKIWFKELAKISAKINKIRSDYLQQLRQIDSFNYFDNLKIDIKNFNYKLNNGWPKETGDTENNIYQYLIDNIDNILKNKSLKKGSQVASIDFYFNKKKENQLSRGEQKTLSIIFWLTQILFLIKNKIKPIVLIDDLPSELDEDKIKSIISFLQKIKIQVFITGITPIKHTKNCNLFNIKNGEIIQNSV